MEQNLVIGGREFTSRLFVGTGKFSSPQLMLDAIIASQSQMITVAMKRVNMMNEATDDMLTHINRDNVQLLPNTSGVRDAREAVLAARMSREIFGTDFIKLEIHPDPKYLMPDPIETLKATERRGARMSMRRDVLRSAYATFTNVWSGPSLSAAFRSTKPSEAVPNSIAPVDHGVYVICPLSTSIFV